MIKKEKYKPEPQEYERIVETICDICGKQQTYEVDEEFGTWDNDAFSIACVSMRYRKGSRYPEGTNYEDQIFDICPSCWKKHILPFIKSFGAKPRKEIIDF